MDWFRDVKTKRNVTMLILAILVASNIPVLATTLAPILMTKTPLPVFETIGSIVALVGIVCLFWMWNKDL